MYYATMSVSVCLYVTEVHWVAVHAGNTAAAQASEVEAIIYDPQQTWPPPMEGSSRAMLATARPSCTTIPACDRRTDRHTMTAYTAL